MRPLPPSHDAVLKLILMFSKNAAEAVKKEDLIAMQIGVLGVQRFAEADRLRGNHMFQRAALHPG